MPIQIVALVGVWNVGWTLAHIAGMAPFAPIESAVRAVGRIVVWVDAAAEVRTAMIRILSSGEPRTSLAMSAKMSLSPAAASRSTPAQAWTAIVTITYVPTRISVLTIVARPGCSVGFALSSLTVAVVSQPQ